MITFANGATVRPTPNAGGTSYVVEASEIGLAPGEWPADIIVTLAARGLEPEMTLGFEKRRSVVGDDYGVDGVVYTSTLGGYILEVLND